MSSIFYVDIPQGPGDYWKNVATKDTRKEALEFIHRHYGGDDEGRISLISEGKTEDEECVSCGEAPAANEHEHECIVCGRTLCNFCFVASARCLECEEEVWKP